MEKEIAKELLKIKAVFLRPNEPFTWTSGIKSPIYCDNRLILSYPNTRRAVENGLASLIKKHFPACRLVAGTSTAGIAHAAYVSEILDLPMVYVRSKSKEHGRNNQIEGRVEKAQKTVVVEDLISTAGSAVDVVEALRAAGADVLGIVSIFTYGMKQAEERLSGAGIENISLTNYDALIEAALEENYIKESDVQKLHVFRENPADPSWMRE